MAFYKCGSGAAALAGIDFSEVDALAENQAMLYRDYTPTATGYTNKTKSVRAVNTYSSRITVPCVTNSITRDPFTLVFKPSNIPLIAQSASKYIQGAVGTNCYACAMLVKDGRISYAGSVGSHSAMTLIPATPNIREFDYVIVVGYTQKDGASYPEVALNII